MVLNVACFFSHYLVYNTTSNNHSNTDKNNHNSEITHQPNLVLISLNGLIWYQGNILAGTNDPDPLGQLNCLQQTFEWARKRKDKDPDHHLYPDQHILISLSLPNQTDQKL
ncbi:unnamed protein product [Schistosoma bovis]|nr:unnamed protein product [Schistosoma bovis]